MSQPRLARLTRIAATRSLLSSASDVDELFSRAAEAARELCGADRALVLGVEGETLDATCSSPLRHVASEVLRRRVVEVPVPVKAGTLESNVVRQGVFACVRSAAKSSLAERLDLRNFMLAPIAVGGRTLAVLVVDGCEARPDALDAALAAACADIIAGAVERIVLRARMAELSAEVRCLTVSAQALMTEAEQAVVSLPSRTSSGRVVFPLMAMAPTASRSMGGLTDVLTEREMKIASRLAAGCSNRQIAEELFLAPSTIKGCVARILRKLDASNRAEAAARYLQMTQASA